MHSLTSAFVKGSSSKPNPGPSGCSWPGRRQTQEMSPGPAPSLGPGLAHESDGLAHACLEQPWIVERIFQYLPISDLLSASQVCRVWYQSGQNVRSRRVNMPELLFLDPYNDVQIADILHPSLDGHLHKTTKNLKQSLLSYPDVVKRRIKQKLDKTFSEPETLLLFAKKSFVNNLNESRRKNEQTNIAVWNLLKSFKLFSPSLVCVGDDDGQPFFVGRRGAEEGCPPHLDFVGLLMPKVPGLTIKSFAIEKKTASIYKKANAQKNCDTMLNISPSDNVKGIIVFAKQESRAMSFVEDFFKNSFYKFQKNQEIELAGGITESVFAEPTDTEIFGSGLVISGGDNVRVRCVCLVDRTLTARNKNLILEFKRLNVDEEGSFAFIISCCDRYSLDRAANADELFFRQNYPNTTVIGTITQGEFYHSGHKAQVSKKGADTALKYRVCVIMFVSTR